MKVLVTGCNGFAGRHVMDVLRATGHEAVGSDVGSPAGGTSTYFHDFKCPATLDLAGKVTHVECPTDSAWMFSETTAVPAV